MLIVRVVSTRDSVIGILVNFAGIGRVRESGMCESGGICLFLVGSMGWSRTGKGQDQHHFPIPGGKHGQWGLWLLEGTSSASEQV